MKAGKFSQTPKLIPIQTYLVATFSANFLTLPTSEERVVYDNVTNHETIKNFRHDFLSQKIMVR